MDLAYFMCAIPFKRGQFYPKIQWQTPHEFPVMMSYVQSVGGAYSYLCRYHSYNENNNLWYWTSS